MKPIPNQPHPDVLLVRALLAKLQPGETVSYDDVAAALGRGIPATIAKRRATAARHILRREGIVIECGNGCYVRLDDQSIVARHAGRERKGMNRKARRAGERLAAVQVAALPADEQTAFFAERTINNVVYQATTSQARTKVIAAAKVQSNVLPMAKALEVLSNGH